MKSQNSSSVLCFAMNFNSNVDSYVLKTNRFLKCMDYDVRAYVRPILILLLLVNCIHLMAESNFNLYRNHTNPCPNYKISINDKIPLSCSYEGVSWIIYDENNNQILDGVGDSLFNYKFTQPGIYAIKFHNPSNELNTTVHDCSKDVHPESMSVEVSPIKMVFLFDDIKFEKDFVAGLNSTGNAMTVPVEITTFNNQLYQIDLNDVLVQGVGSQITANPVVPSIEVNSSIIHITYSLNGIASLSQAILMFDIEDNNGNIHCYTHPEPVK